MGDLVLDGQGNLYGTTEYGGANNDGTVFEIAKGSNTITIPAVFNGTNGAYPQGDLVLDAQGNLYGTTAGGPPGSYGTVFEIDKGSKTSSPPSPRLTAPTRRIRWPGVVLDGQGNLYGTTLGLETNDGTVFEIASGSNNITTLASFNGTDGAHPLGNLTLDAQGNLYGTTFVGGAYNYGTVFELSPQDTTPPTSTVSPLPKTESSLVFPVTVTGTDPNGSGGSSPSGIASFAVYVSTNGGAWTLWQTLTPPSSTPGTATANFTGMSNFLYAPSIVSPRTTPAIRRPTIRRSRPAPICPT